MNKPLMFAAIGGVTGLGAGAFINHRRRMRGQTLPLTRSITSLVG